MDQMVAERAGTLQAPFAKSYDNFIGGRWVAPSAGRYFDNVSPITGKAVCQVARSDAADIELALDAAHAAKGAWGRASPAERSLVLTRIADRMEENLGKLALAETWDNGKPIRETTAADIPLAIDHFRYFAGCIRSQEGSISQIDNDTVGYHFHEPLGVVGQIIPWNFPLLMAAWKIAPALAAGNCVVLKPAEQTPASIMVLMELIADLLPDGVLNVVNGFGLEAGKPLASSKRIAKIAFTGETTTGKLIMQYASENLIPVTLELGGKSPNIFFADVCTEDDDFLDKAIEGFVMFALNQGEVCTCPSRALIQESVYDKFMEKALKRVAAIRQGSPLDMETMIGAQASEEQQKKILGYLDIGRSIANDTMFGLGAGVWSRDANTCYRFGRGIQAGHRIFAAPTVVPVRPVQLCRAVTLPGGQRLQHHPAFQGQPSPISR
ncbi:MAG: aldehyde dehydrogenase family protein [Novosphingobium sp.]